MSIYSCLFIGLHVISFKVHVRIALDKKIIDVSSVKASILIFAIIISNQAFHVKWVIEITTILFNYNIDFLMAINVSNP